MNESSFSNSINKYIFIPYRSTTAMFSLYLQL